MIERVLNHSSGGSKVAPIYNRYDYAEEKRAALEAWAQHVIGIVADNVVPIMQGRA